MRKFVLGIFLLADIVVYGQFHDANIRQIETCDEAKRYASRHRDVSFGLVNSEMDVFLFDNVDLSNMKASLGKEYTLYRRRTKFLKDTMISMANVQVVEFDIERLGMDSVKVLMKEMIQQYMKGNSYWSLLKRYQSETCTFNGGPIATDLLEKRFGSNFEDRTRDEIFEWESMKKPGVPVLIIIHQEAHSVPAFYAISYNVAG